MASVEVRQKVTVVSDRKQERKEGRKEGSMLDVRCKCIEAFTRAVLSRRMKRKGEG